MNIHAVLKLADWEKKWLVPNYTLLSSSLLSEGYGHTCVIRFGSGLPREFYIHDQDAVVCYQSKEENKKFGRLIAQLIKKQRGFLPSLITEVERRTKEFSRFIKTSKNISVVIFEEFKRLHFDYLPAFVAVSRSANYITGKSATKTLANLRKARLFSESMYSEADEYLKKSLNLIARKEKVSLSNLLKLHYRELDIYLASGKLPSIRSLQQRVGLYDTSQVQKFFPASDSKKFESTIANAYGLKKGYATGLCAVAGYARGAVRIVTNPTQDLLFNKGDILLTSMTRPQFIFLMKKAGAIVTDAGGILSHAAIVARELKKPCIIGTQTATQAFKNGDFVEVDATKGIVKKL